MRKEESGFLNGARAEPLIRGGLGDRPSPQPFAFRLGPLREQGTEGQATQVMSSEATPLPTGPDVHGEAWKGGLPDTEA